MASVIPIAVRSWAKDESRSPRDSVADAETFPDLVTSRSPTDRRKFPAIPTLRVLPD